MSNELHNTLHALGENWFGTPGWAWLAFVALVLLLMLAAQLKR